MTDHNPAIGHLSLSLLSYLLRSRSSQTRRRTRPSLLSLIFLSLFNVYMYFLKKTLPFILLFYWEKNENRDKDGQSGIFMPFGVKKQKSTLTA